MEEARFEIHGVRGKTLENFYHQQMCKTVKRIFLFSLMPSKLVFKKVFKIIKMFKSLKLLKIKYNPMGKLNYLSIIFTDYVIKTSKKEHNPEKYVERKVYYEGN